VSSLWSVLGFLRFGAPVQVSRGPSEVREPMTDAARQNSSTIKPFVVVAILLALLGALSWRIGLFRQRRAVASPAAVATAIFAADDPVPALTEPVESTPLRVSSDERMLILVNPSAGAGGLRIATGGTPADDVDDVMKARGLSYDLVVTRSADDARAHARQAVRDRRSIVAVAGGDGTIESVLPELVGTNTALGILPTGSMMNVGRSLGITRDLDQAADVLQAGRVVRMDVARANRRYFLEFAGVGLGGAILLRHQRTGENTPLAAAVGRWLMLALRFRPHRIRLKTDHGEFETRALLTLVSNSPYWGPGVAIAPDALVDDGLLDVTIFTAANFAEVARDVVTLLRGRQPSTGVTRFSTTRLTVEHIRRPLPVHVGIDYIGRSPLSVEIMPRALAVVANVARIPVQPTTTTA
jgi:diacylglycerol kinase (ATP)